MVKYRFLLEVGGRLLFLLANVGLKVETSERKVELFSRKVEIFKSKVELFT